MMKAIGISCPQLRRIGKQDGRVEARHGHCLAGLADRDSDLVARGRLHRRLAVRKDLQLGFYGRLYSEGLHELVEKNPEVAPLEGSAMPIELASINARRKSSTDVSEGG